jgi:hypothetical protein
MGLSRLGLSAGRLPTRVGQKLCVIPGEIDLSQDKKQVTIWELGKNRFTWVAFAIAFLLAKAVTGSKEYLKGKENVRVSRKKKQKIISFIN